MINHGSKLIDYKQSRDITTLKLKFFAKYHEANAADVTNANVQDGFLLCSW